MLPRCRTAGEPFVIPTFDMQVSDVEGFMNELGVFAQPPKYALHCIFGGLLFRLQSNSPRRHDVLNDHPRFLHHDAIYHQLQHLLLHLEGRLLK